MQPGLRIFCAAEWAGALRFPTGQRAEASSNSYRGQNAECSDRAVESSDRCRGMIGCVNGRDLVVYGKQNSINRERLR